MLLFLKSSCLFYLRFNFDICVSKISYDLGIFHANQTTKYLRNQSKTKGEGWSIAPSPPIYFITGRPKAALLFWLYVGFRSGMWLCFVTLVRFKKGK